MKVPFPILFLPKIQCLLLRLSFISVVKYLNVITDIAIIRAPRDYDRLVWAAITMITALHKVSCAMNIIHIGGNAIRLILLECVYMYKGILKLNRQAVFCAIHNTVVLSYTTALHIAEVLGEFFFHFLKACPFRVAVGYK